MANFYAQVPLILNHKLRRHRSKGYIKVPCAPHVNPLIEKVRRKLRGQRLPHTEIIKVIDGLPCVVFRAIEGRTE